MIREKLDDNNVRIGSLTQEVDALRQAMQQLSDAAVRRPTADPDAGAARRDGAQPSAAAAPPSAAPSPIGTSPQKLFDAAHGRLHRRPVRSRRSLGFEATSRASRNPSRPTTRRSTSAHAYLQAGKNEKAVEAYDAAIRNYPNGDAFPRRTTRRALALSGPETTSTSARAAFEYVVKTYPDSDAAPSRATAAGAAEPARKPCVSAT